MRRSTIITREITKMFEEFVVSGNDVLLIKLVRSRDDINDESCIFKPIYCHQIFGDGEKIFGFKGLKIHLYYGACSLTTYLSCEYSEQIQTFDTDNVPDDPVKKIKEILPPGTLNDIRMFTKEINDEYKCKPFGKNLNSLNISSRVFILNTCTAEEKGYTDFHNRLQTFILWFIESGNLIDISDPKWRIFLIYERYIDNRRRTCHSVVGCATVYQFFSYPSGIKPRISQVLILPPFQKLGLCSWLLKNIYAFYSMQPNTSEITVEDPSDEFQRVRDYVDCLTCLKAQEFAKENLLTGFKQEMINYARKCLINLKQARRVYEILRLKVIDLNNGTELKKYKQELYSRLADNSRNKSASSNKHRLRKLALAKFVKPKLNITNSKKMGLLISELTKSYQKVIQRLLRKEKEDATHPGYPSHHKI